MGVAKEPIGEPLQLSGGGLGLLVQPVVLLPQLPNLVLQVGLMVLLLNGQGV